MSLKVRVQRALAANLCGHVLVTAGNLILVPLYLYYWSPSEYGEWLVLIALTGYLSTFDLGMNMAVANKLTQAYARRDLVNYSRYQHSSFAFYIFVSICGSVILALAIWSLPNLTWLGLREIPVSEAKWAIWLLSLSVLWSMPTGLMLSVYRTTGNLARSLWISNALQLMTLGFVALALFLGGSVQSVATWQLVPLLAVSAFVIQDILQNYPELSPSLQYARLSTLRTLIKPSLLFGLLTLSNVITLHGSVIILSTSLGAVAVAVFVTSRTLVNLIRQMVGAFINSLWSEITAMEAHGEWERLRSLHRLLMAGSTALCIGLAASLWYEGREVITVWTGGRLEPDAILLRLMLVLLVLQSTWLISLVFTASTNRHFKLSWLYLASAVIGIGVAALLVNRLGTWAIPVGLIAGESVACYHFVIKDTCVMIHEPYGPFALRLWAGLLVISTITLLAGWVAHLTMLSEFYLLRWIFVGSITSLISIAMAWRIWLTQEDRSQVHTRLHPWLQASKA